MFVQIDDLLCEGEEWTIKVKKGSNGRLKITVLPPKAGAKLDAMSSPLMLSGTPVELDEGLAQAITTFGTSRKSLAEQVATTTAILDSEKEAQSKKAVKALKKPTDAGSGVASDSSSPDDDDIDEVTPAPVKAAEQTKVATEPGKTDMSQLLFGGAKL